MEIRVGILEDFKNDPKKMKNVSADLEDLRKMVRLKFDELAGEKDLPVEEIEKILAKEEDKRKQWESFLKDEYTPKLKTIVDKVDEINKEICPGYTGN